MIATHAHCGSPDCPHKHEHTYDPEWCGVGSCRWAEGTLCVDARQDKLRDILDEFWTETITQDEAVHMIVDLLTRPTIAGIPMPAEPGEHAEAPGSHLIDDQERH